MNAELKAKVNEFLVGLDANSRTRLEEIGIALYDVYATSFPGPFDATVKKTARPHVRTAIDNFVIDVCSGI